MDEGGQTSVYDDGNDNVQWIKRVNFNIIVFCQYRLPDMTHGTYSEYV